MPVPEPLYWYRWETPGSEAKLTTGNRSQWRSLRATLDHVSTELRPLLVMLRGLQCLPRQGVEGDLGEVERSAAAKGKSFLRLDSAGGWGNLRATYDLKLEETADGLVLHATGGDPQLQLELEALPAAPLIANIEISSPATTWLQLFYVTRTQPEFCEAQSLRYPLLRGPNLITIELPPRVALLPLLRIDPASCPGTFLLHAFELSHLEAKV
jgi:hypothetical protein